MNSEQRKRLSLIRFANLFRRIMDSGKDVHQTLDYLDKEFPIPDEFNPPARQGIGE